MKATIRRNVVTVEYSVPSLPDSIKCSFCGRLAAKHIVGDETFDPRGMWVEVEQKVKYLCVCEFDRPRDKIMNGQS